MTRTVLAVSPHLDDAVFSAGGTLAQRARGGWRVVIATCFTASVAAPTGFALACQRDKGLADDVDYMALRRAEDLAAGAVLGAEAVHLDFAEAPHRGYASAAALFAGVRADDRVDLAPALAALVEAFAPDQILGPLGIGGHVDHLVVRAALAPYRAALWEDWPYADRAAAPGPALETIALDAADIAAKTAAARCYATQLAFQFGSADALAARLAAITTERFHGPA